MPWRWAASGTGLATAIPRIGRPEEVAAAIAFLASDDASFITGAVLPGRRRLDRCLARYLKWKASVFVGVGPEKPTAQASVAEMDVTPARKSPLLTWMLGAWVQAVPSQRRARVDGAAVGDGAHRPGVAGGDLVHCGELDEGPGVGAGHLGNHPQDSRHEHAS